MAKYSNTIEYNISTKLDSKGLTQLQQQLKQIEISIQKMDNAGSLNSKIADARTQIKGLGNALSEAFNPSLGMVDLAKFNTALKENGVSAVELRNAFQLAGADGQVAFNNLVGQLGQLDLGLKRSSSSLNKIATTFGNTFRWGVIASFFSQFMNAIHSSVDYVKELDDSLTQIMLVTDYNRDSMNAYAKAANEAAKAVGQTTVGMTNASLIFAQQGYDLNQSQELATLSAKLANASQQDTATTSDQITAYMNAYGLSSSIEDLSSALDSWALVANVSAADVAELATASQKAASTANSVGVNMDQLNAQIATIESVTRDAPEQIGNGLKTLYARFSDIKLGKTLEDGVNLGQVTGQLNKLGVQVLDQFGNIRDVGDILEDLMVIWDDLDQTTKEASAQTLAGKFQMNRFLALMDNSDMYREYLGASENAAGTLDQMNAEYLDSLEGRTAKIQASLEGIFSSIFDTDVVYPFIDAMQKFLDILQTLIDSLGGGSTIVLGLVSAFTQLFSNQIAQGINDFNINQAISKQRQENYQNSAATLDRLGAINPNPNDENSQAILNYARKMNEMQPYLSQDQAKQANEILIEMIAHTNDLTKAQQEYNDQMSKVGAIASATFDDKLMAPFEQEDAVNYQMLSEELKNWNNILEGSGEKIAQAKEEWKEFQDTLQTQNIQIITEKWQELENIFGGTPFGEKVKAELEKIKAGSTDANESLADLTGGAQRFLELLESYKSGDLRAEDFIKELEKLDQLNVKVKMKEATVEGTQKIAGAVEQGIDSQQQIKQIVDTVGALGQLAFAIQSVQNLGSIWKNEDLTTGEKIVQTIANLSMVIPSVVTSLQKLTGLQGWEQISNLRLFDFENLKSAQSLLENNLVGAQEKVAAALNKVSQATQKVKQAEESLNKAREAGNSARSLGGYQSALTKARNEETKATNALTTAQENLNIVQKNSEKVTEELKAAEEARAAVLKGIVLAGVVAVIMALSAYNDHLNQIKKNTINDFNEINQSLTDNKNKIEDFHNLRLQFEKTGEGAEELKEKALELADSLDISGENALIAAGNFELLERRMREAADIQAENTIMSGEAAISANANDYGIRNNFFDYDINDEISAAVAGNRFVVDTFANAEGYTDDPLQRIGALRDTIAAVDEELNHLEPGTQEYTDLFEAREKLYSTWNSDQVQNILTEANTIADLTLSLSDYQEQIQKVSKNGPKALMDLFSSNEAIMSAANVSGDVDNYLMRLISQYDTTYSNLYSILGELDEEGRRTIDFSTLDGQELDLSNISGLTEEDWQALGFESYQAFIQALQEAASVPATIKPNINLENPWNLDTEEKAQSYLDTYTDIDMETLETAARLRAEQGFENNGDRFNNSGEIQQTQSQVGDLSTARESTSSTLERREITEDLTEAQKELNEAIADSEENERLYRQAMKDAAAAEARQIKTLEDMYDHFEENKEILDENNVGSIEYAEALNQTKEDLAGLLNIDASSLSDDFFKTTNALELMNTVLNGTDEEADQAFRDLQALASDNLIRNMEFDIPVGLEDKNGNPITSDIIRSTLTDMVNYLQQDLPGIDIEANIQTQDWYDRVNELLASGALTAEQLTQTLSSAGYVGQLDYKQAAGWTTKTTYEVTYDGAQTIGEGPSAISMPTTISMIPHYEQVWGEDVSVPVLTGATQTNPISVPRQSAGGGKTGGKGGGGRKGGGGKGKKGSGGKAKTIEPKEKKEHEKDYYEEVNSQLDKTEKILSRIEKEEDRLIGDKARANQNKQLDLLQKEINLNEEKLEINKQELKDTDERLKQQDKLAEQILKQQGLSMLIPEPVFDEDGVIANFEQISKALDDAHNQLIDKYNAAAKAGNEELTKEIEKQIGKFDDYSKNLLDAAKRHDTLQSEIEETTNALEDLKDSIEDIQIAAYNAALDAAEEWQDLMDKGAELQGFFREFDPDSYLRSFSIDERPYERIIEDLYTLQNEYAVAGDQANQFYNDIIAQKRKELEETNDLYEQQAILDAIQYFEDEQSRVTEDFLENGVVGYWSRRLEELQQWMDNPNDASNPFGENTAELVETYKRVWEQAAEETENFREKVQDLRDDIIDAVEEFDDDLDRQYDKFEDLIDELEQIGDTYTLYYGDDSYTELANILQKEGEVLQSELDRRQQEYEKWVKLYQQALETGDKKTIQAIEDLMNDARKEMRDSAEQLAEVWVKQFETSINRSTQQMTQNVWGRNDLEELSDNWELEKQYIEDYKDEVEKAYEIDKLRSKYIDLLNDAQGASLATQNKIRQEMQDQLNYLENQATVSEYDVKLANAKLEILQKQIALEDAQRNKNRMQLRRDTQGNYRYVYRADDDDIKQAQDELLESSYDIYEITKDQTITNNDRMISSFLDFQEKARNIAEKYKDDEVARQAALNDLAEQYKKTWAALGEDFGDVTNGMYDVLWWNINNLIGDSATASLEKMNQLYDENGNIKEKTGEQWRDLATEIQNDVIDKVYDSAIDCITDINISGQRLASNIAGSLDVIGAGIDSLDISLAEATNTTRNLKEATDDLFAAFNGDNAQINNAMKMISDYRAELEKTQNSASNLAKQLTEANKKIANLTAENTAYKTSINNSPSKRTGSSGSSSGGGSSSSGGSGSSGGNSSSGGNRSSGGSSSSGGSKGKSANSIANSITKKNSYQWQNHTSGTSSALGGKRLLMYYDSGGYTGEWGSDGRLAVLHQKELVLNAEDTENILGAVAMMRGMISAIQTGALSKSISSSINNANKNFGDTIEQRVEINATFPNVTSADEIEAALLGLSDKAYQYSYRTR